MKLTERMCLFFPPCREEREEEEQQKLKEQHDIPASSLQSPGEAGIQGKGGDLLQGVQVCPAIVLGDWGSWGSSEIFLQRDDFFTSHTEK